MALVALTFAALLAVSFAVDPPAAGVAERAPMQGQQGFPQRPPGQQGFPQRPPGQQGFPQRPPGQQGFPQRPPGQQGFPQRPPGQQGFPQWPPGQQGFPQRPSGQQGFPQRPPITDSNAPQSMPQPQPEMRQGRQFYGGFVYPIMGYGHGMHGGFGSMGGMGMGGMGMGGMGR